MSVAVGDILQCAVSLAEAGALPEASARAVVSRAYYAAYHDSRLWHDFLPHAGNDEGAKGTHHRLCLRLEKPHGAIPHETRLKSARRGILLRKFHGDRVTADYTLQDLVDSADAAQAIADARVILSIA